MVFGREWVLQPVDAFSRADGRKRASDWPSPNTKSSMFGRSSRIRLSRDYERLFQYGRSFHTPYLTLKTVQNQQDLNRFGIVVSNKVDKRAVVRNKMKRRKKAKLLWNGWFFSPKTLFWELYSSTKGRYPQTMGTFPCFFHRDTVSFFHPVQSICTRLLRKKALFWVYVWDLFGYCGVTLF